MIKRFVPIVLCLAGCAELDGNVQTYWGPDGTSDGRTTLTPGEEIAFTGLVTRAITETEPPLDLVEVVLVAANTPVTCSMYGAWLSQVAELQAYAADVVALAEAERPAEWQAYVCQELSGAARDVFGGDGSYRALHTLLNATGGGPDGDLFRPAAPGGTSTDYLGGEILDTQPGTYVARLYERSHHAAGVLPSSADTTWEGQDISPIDGCAGVISVLATELADGRTTYPDANAIALQAATHRWYHHDDDRESVGLAEGGQLPVGITFPDWQEAATTGGALSATLFQSIARAPATFPYEYVLLTTEGRQVEVDACTALNTYTPMIWPEVEQLGASAVAPGDDDDDDSAQ